MTESTDVITVVDAEGHVLQAVEVEILVTDVVGALMDGFAQTLCEAVRAGIAAALDRARGGSHE